MARPRHRGAPESRRATVRTGATLSKTPFGRSVLTKQEETMAPFRNVITAPAAWTNRGIGGKAGLTQRLTDAQLAAFDTVLTRSRHLKPQQATRADFDHPEI